MKTYLHQAKAGPRWVLEMDYHDTLSPERFERIMRDGRREWGVTKMVILWGLRPPSGLRLNLKVDIKIALGDPPKALFEMARRAARNAIANDMTHLLPPQFHDGREPIVTSTGAPILGADGRPLTSETKH